MADWDPIGVRNVPEAADEYDAYLGAVYERLEQGASEGKLSAYLRAIEVERIELIDQPGEPLLREEYRRAAVASIRRLGVYFPYRAENSLFGK